MTSKLRCLQSGVTDSSPPERNSVKVCAGGDEMGDVVTENRVHICDAIQEMEEEEKEGEQ